MFWLAGCHMAKLDYSCNRLLFFNFHSIKSCYFYQQKIKKNKKKIKKHPKLVRPIFKLSFGIIYCLQ